MPYNNQNSNGVYISSFTSADYATAINQIRSCCENATPKIRKVIFHEPATIVIWEDGTKTVVKVQNEPYDAEKGLAMAISKKFFGNKSNFNNIFKKYLPKEN